MSLPKDEFKSDYYDYVYFADVKGKEFKRGGKTEYWGYKNPDGNFEGAKPIVKAWKTMFNPKNMLDVGAGRGQFVSMARDVGIEAEGFDFSKFAVGEGRYAKCKPEWLKLHDATKTWPYRDASFDLVTALDFWEHIYSDLPHLPCDVRSLIYLKCYTCSQERNGLCPLRLAVSAKFGENVKGEREEKTLFIEQSKMRLPKLGVKSRRNLIQKVGKKEIALLVDMLTKKSRETLKDWQNVDDKIGKECADGEKLIEKNLDSKLSNHITNVWNTSEVIQMNIKNFWKNTDQVKESVMKNEKKSFTDLEETNAKFVEERINELLKSITSMAKEKNVLQYMKKIGVNCNSCVPTVIRLCTPDLNFVKSEMFRVAKKWIFLQIATVDGVKEKGYILKKGEPIPWEDGRTWAGHCTVMPPDFWIEKFEHDEWMLRRDMVNWFCSLVDKNVIHNWLLNTMIVLERI